MKELFGIIPYVVSPINADGTVKKESLDRLIRDLLMKGVDGICALGSSGEFPYLLSEQKEEIVRIAVNSAKCSGKPVVAGVSGFSVQECVNEATEFVSLGADAIVLMINSYFLLSDEALSLFIHEVSASIPETPIVLYSNPRFMHYSFSLRLFSLIEDCANVLYYKDASGYTGFLLSIVQQFGSRYKIFSASAHVPLFVFELGGVGWMSGPSCIIPEASVELYRLWKDGKKNEALALQKRLWSVNVAFNKYSLSSCVKAVLNHKGYDVGLPIPPNEGLRKESEEEIFSLVDTINRDYSEETL